MKHLVYLSIIALTGFFPSCTNSREACLSYRVTMEDPGAHIFHMTLQAEGLQQDTVIFKLPRWTPGYYQIMDYAGGVSDMEATRNDGSGLTVTALNDNTWRVVPGKETSFTLRYTLSTERQFVASSYLDAERAYIVPANNFLYIDGRLDLPVQVEIIIPPGTDWDRVATGLTPVRGNPGIFSAPNFDIFYDCPILAGKLEELPAFEIQGVTHRFIGYRMGAFDREAFMEGLKKVAEAGITLMRDIPMNEYTFIAIGPGRGGIEHLNNTTISFDGSRMQSRKDMLNVLNFIGHEYFHLYNGKRIRPLELGPFDYDRENRTTQLWISEGLTVYYEYVLTRMAGLAGEEEFLSSFGQHIDQVENNPGRLEQSLVQSSYNTWEDGPFGVPGSTISYYEKGPVVGLFLDLAIRHATENRKSLDDVMRFLYLRYYRELGRGFSDAEFQQACESIAGQRMTEIFGYIHTAGELDYATYLDFAGLEVVAQKTGTGEERTRYILKKQETIDPYQQAIFNSWSRN